MNLTADSPTATLDSVVARLSAAVDHAADLDPALVPATDLGELLEAVQRQVNRLDAAVLAWTTSFERRNGPRATGHRNAQHYLQDRLRLSPTAAKQRVDTARALNGDLQDTRQALERGDVTLAQATAIAQAARQAARDRDRLGTNDRSDAHQAQGDGDPEAAQDEQGDGAGGGAAPSVTPRSGDGAGTDQPAAGEVEQVEQDLLEQAGRHHDGELRKAARRRELVRRPDPEAGAREAYLRRTLTLRHQGDTTWIEGRVHQSAGDALASALADHAQSTGPDDSRDHGQRMADALVDLCTSSLRCGCTPGAGTPPTTCRPERGTGAVHGARLEGDTA